jgi:hypothetical protein
MSDVVPIQRTLQSRFGVVTGTPQTLSTSGDHDIYTPATGNRVRLKWLWLSSPEANTASVLATVKWSGATGNIYLVDLGAPGAFAHGSVREGATDEKVVVNLDGAQTVRVNVDVEEFR